MPTSIVTLEDLQQLKSEILHEIEKMLSGQQPGISQKWLKSSDVRKLLKLSPGTLQNLRINGTLPFTKVGGIIFYNADDIQGVLEKNKAKVVTKR